MVARNPRKLANVLTPHKQKDAELAAGPALKGFFFSPITEANQMEFLTLQQHPPKGIGLELPPEAMEALEQIRAGWSDDVRASRISGSTTSQMVATFQAHGRLVERMDNKHRRRLARKKEQGST